MNLTKSRYVQGKRCNKALWLSCYKPEVQEENNNEAVLENGNKVGELARSLFGDYTLIEYNKDKSIMINKTLEKLKEKPNIICEASFSYKNNYCAVDILKNDNDGVEIYEVKSSAEINESYIDDISYQTWLLKKCGLKVKKSCLIYINNQYIFNGELELDKLFNIEDVSDEVLSKEDDVEKTVEDLEETINSKEEPKDDISINCNKGYCSYECPFFKYCIKDLPTPNVFDVGWSVQFTKKLDLYYQNKVSFEDLLNDNSLNDKAMTQIDFYIHNLKPKINKEKIKNFLDQFKFPLYFLDFESYQASIPTVVGTKPYQQICFQYSLHYLLKPNGKLYHKEYLSEDYNGNPMYELSKRLCEDIPMDSCVIAYHKGFECSRLNEMANLFPEFREHLLNISDNIVDLEEPFASQSYYIKEMGGRRSIKVVLPALYPNDPSLDYHSLNQVHKGDEASAAYLALPNLSKKEEKQLRHDMLEYCKLDTLATVKLYEKLKEAINE